MKKTGNQALQGLLGENTFYTLLEHQAVEIDCTTSFRSDASLFGLSMTMGELNAKLPPSVKFTLLSNSGSFQGICSRIARDRNIVNIAPTQKNSFWTESLRRRFRSGTAVPFFFPCTDLKQNTRNPSAPFFLPRQKNEANVLKTSQKEFGNVYLKVDVPKVEVYEPSTRVYRDTCSEKDIVEGTNSL